MKYKPFCAYIQHMMSNATDLSAKASTSNTASYIVVQPLAPTDDKRLTDTGRGQEEPSAPPLDNSVPRRPESSTGHHPDGKDPSGSTTETDTLPTYDEVMEQDQNKES